MRVLAIYRKNGALHEFEYETYGFDNAIRYAISLCSDDAELESWEIQSVDTNDYAAGDARGCQIRIH